MTQMTRNALAVAVVAAVCLWAVIIGAFVAVTAPNGFPGMVAVLAGLIGLGACLEWLNKTDGGRR
jgi:hypothetical protein